MLFISVFNKAQPIIGVWFLKKKEKEMLGMKLTYGAKVRDQTCNIPNYIFSLIFLSL